MCDSTRFTPDFRLSYGNLESSFCTQGVRVRGEEFVDEDEQKSLR